MEYEHNYMLIKSAIYGFAVGDAIGVPIEFEPRERLMKCPVTQMYGYGSYDIPKGVWSDDTSMTLATMNSIIENKSINYNDMADKFCNWINNAEYTATNEIFDIGVTVKYALIRYWEDKTDATRCGGKSYNENGNGSLMRMLPIAFYCYYKNLNDDKIYEVVLQSSSITHAHEISILGCYIYVKYIIFLLNGKTKNESYNLIKELNYKKFNISSLEKYNRILKDDISNVSLDKIYSTGYIVYTLESVLWIILNTDTFNQAIIGAINLGGDTDTIGAITGSLAGIIYGFEFINKNWLEDLKGKEILNRYIEKFATAFEPK